MPRAQLWKGVWETFHWNTLKFGFDFISPLQIHHGWGFWHFSKYAFYFGPASKVTHTAENARVWGGGSDRSGLESQLHHLSASRTSESYGTSELVTYLSPGENISGLSRGLKDAGVKQRRTPSSSPTHPTSFSLLFSSFLSGSVTNTHTQASRALLHPHRGLCHPEGRHCGDCTAGNVLTKTHAPPPQGSPMPTAVPLAAGTA